LIFSATYFRVWSSFDVSLIVIFFGGSWRILHEQYSIVLSADPIDLSFKKSREQPAPILGLAPWWGVLDWVTRL
jgi:hypothetical protein